MLGAGDAMRLATSKRTVYSNSFSKTLGEGPNETLIRITTTVEEAAAESKGTRIEVR